MSVFCEDEFWFVVDEPTGLPPVEAVATCSRREGHDRHHCDRVLRVAWYGSERLVCLDGYDHGLPPNRADRRGNPTLKPQHLARKFPGDPRG